MCVVIKYRVHVSKGFNKLYWRSINNFFFVSRLYAQISGAIGMSLRLCVRDVQ